MIRKLLFLFLTALAGCGAERPAPPLLDEATITLRGHDELSIAGGQALPLAFGEQPVLGVCIAVSPGTDTSQWEARLAQGADAVAAATFSGPVTRLRESLCFDLELAAGQSGPVSLCGEVRDRYDGTTDAFPCIEIERRPDDPTLAALRDEARPIIAARETLPLERFVERIDEVRGRAMEAGYSFLPTRLTLVAAYMLRREGSPESWATAAERLDARPPWQGLPHAAAWEGHLSYGRATFALERDDLLVAWRRLETAVAAYGAVAHPDRIAAEMKQAELLARVGAGDDARRRLRGSLETCDTAPCREDLVVSARNTLAWLLLQDLDATPRELEDAQRILGDVLDGLPEATDPVERANVMINLAYAGSRAGVDPAPALAEARRLLATVGASPGSRADALAGWTTIVEAFHALDAGEPERALDLCGAAVARSGRPRLQAWALSCAARAHRRAGDLDRAADAFDGALAFHEHTTGASIGQDIAPGPDQRAEDFYRAARLAVERRRPGEAWGLLERLERFERHEPAVAGGGDPACGERPSAARVAERERLLDELALLEAPASGARRAQRRAIREQLATRLQTLLRAGSSCNPSDRRSAVGGRAGYRAVALEDEIVVLRKLAGGAVELYRRTPRPRLQLAAEIDRLVEAMDERADDDRWRRLARPLAEALVPSAEDLDETIAFTLHGLLQRVPLAALPLPAGDGRWLADATVVVHRPAAGAGPAAAAGLSVAADRGVFVVDPQRNLPAAAELAGVYRRLFPASAVLEGAEASVERMRAELADARWLHLDVHARYDPAFPELSRLLLSDGPLLADQLAPLTSTLYLANLAACDSGRWPATAGSGRFGLAGHLVRGGVSWTIGARTRLDDRLAAEFNVGFYEALAGGSGVPRAFGRALGSLRGRYPASAWAALLLLSGEIEDAGGQSATMRTPKKRGPCAAAAGGADRQDPEGAG